MRRPTSVPIMGRLRDLSPQTIDVLVALAVAVPTLMDAWWNEPGTRQAGTATYALAAGSIFVLLARRTWPIATAIATGVALSGLYLLGHNGELLNLPTMVALYTVATHTNRRTVIAVGLVASAWSGLLGFTSDSPLGARGGSPVLEMIWPLVPLAFGDAVRSRRELAEIAATESEREAERRIAEERAHMAREVHDVVAHTVAAVNVQMAAAVAAFDDHPDIARDALHKARAASNAALDELRASVTLARNPGNTTPAPGLDRISELAQPVRAAGIDVTFVEHDTPEVSATTTLAAYRVVQEALTNVVRHSNASKVTVSIRETLDTIVIEITDDGATGVPASPPAPGHGFGLIGMDERVRNVGGSLTHGPRSSGGFAVRAELPMSHDRS